MSEQEKTYTTKQAAVFLSVKTNTLEKWRTARIGPAFSRVGNGRGKILYRFSELVRYLDKTQQEEVV
jgi:hypothetical protein